MGFDYEDIVCKYYEGIKPLFINYLRKSFNIDYDDIMNIYADVWIDVRENIMNSKINTGTNWKAYILKMGWYQANKFATRRPALDSIDDESFNMAKFEREFQDRKEAEKTLFENPEMHDILASELSYIPDPCNKILTLYYFEGFSMSEIAMMMNYSNARTAITTNNRCKNKLKIRVINAARRIGLIS